MKPVPEWRFHRGEDVKPVPEWRRRLTERPPLADHWRKRHHCTEVVLGREGRGEAMNYKPGKPKEVRITSASGGQKGQKDIRLGGADPLSMMELGRIYGMGERKYDRFNYLKGYDWSLSIDALKRHLLAFEAGEAYDECSAHPGQHGDDHEYDPAVCDGSGLLHTAHVAWHGLALTSFLIRQVGTDDRAPQLQL